MGFSWNKPEDVVYLRDIFPRYSRRGIYLIILAIVVLSALFTTFYTIQPNELGVVLRLGKFVGKTSPGLHLKLPFGIDRAIPVKVEYIYKEEFGFRTKEAGVRSTYQSRSYDEESIMLTGDLNVLDLEWIVQFKIEDPYAALFNIRDIQKTLHDISESVMRKIVGDYTFSSVLTTMRRDIDARAQEELQEILDSYDSGIRIVTVKLQDVNPPDPVKPAFNEVNQAKQEKEKMIKQAEEAYNKRIPQAKGEALKMVEEAEGYALETINNAEGDARRFLLRWQAYSKAKDITLKRLYLDSMREVMSRAGKKYIVDSQQKTILPWLKMDNEK